MALLKTMFPLWPIVWGVERKCCWDTQQSIVAGHCSTSDTMSDLDWHENVNNNLNECVHTHMSASYIMYA